MTKTYTAYIDNIRVKIPTRADHLLKVPRELLLMSSEDQWRKVNDEELIEALGNKAVKCNSSEVLDYSGLVCDACNEPLMFSYIWCLILGLHSWGALCEKCKEYHNKLPQYVIWKKSVFDLDKEVRNGEL